MKVKTGKRHKKPLSFFSVFVYIKRSARFQGNRKQATDRKRNP